MKIAISTLFFYKRDLSLEFLRALLPTLLKHLERTPGDAIEFLITENTPPAESTLEAARALAQGFPHERLRVSFTQNPANEGFGGAHNQAFGRCAADTDVFVVLNNDLFMERDDWLARLIAPFADERVAIVGPRSAPRVLLDDGNGTWAKPEDGERADYVEGSVLAIRAPLARRFGLFAPDLPWAYFEDSDLCLRYRQLGYQLALADIPHEHRRGASTALLGADTLRGIRERNQRRFLARWGRYLYKRSFSNRLLVDLSSGGWGDVVAALPTLLRLLKDHPTARIDARTNFEAMVPLLEMDRVTVQLAGASRLGDEEYDRVFTLSGVDFTSPAYLGNAIALAAGVEFDPAPAKEHLLKLAAAGIPARLGMDSRVELAVVHAESIRQDWEGRAISPEALIPSLQLLKAEGYTLALAGGVNPPPEYAALARYVDHDLCGKASLRDLVAVLGRASLYVGIDSGPLHLAQLLGVPTFAIFGATLPSSKLLALDSSYGLQLEGLDCLGCYHRGQSRLNNYCVRRDQACVRSLEGKLLAERLADFLNGELKFSAREFGRMRALLDERTSATERFYRDEADLDQYRLRTLVSVMRRKVWRIVQDRLPSRGAPHA